MKAQAQYNKECFDSFPPLQQEARCELNNFVNEEVLPFCAEPINLRIKLDRALTFRRHLESLRKKLTFCIVFLKQFAKSSWSVDATHPFLDPF